jgi:hypothetical protein
MKIFYTNWINIVGIFSVLFLYTTIYDLADQNVSRNIFQAMTASLISIFLYGLIFWIGFILLLIVLDLILIVPNSKHLKFKLFIECVIISSPFIYWGIEYEKQRVIYLLAIGTFYVTQFLRSKLISEN